MHGNEERGVGILRGDFTNGPVAHCQIIFQIDFLERGIFSHQLHRERAGFALPRDLRRSVARGPSIVVTRDAAQHMFARLRLQKLIVAPALGKRSRQVRVVRMRDEPPSRLSLESQHCFPSLYYSSLISPRRTHNFRVSSDGRASESL